MGNSISTGYEHYEYHKAEDIVFVPDGPDPYIGAGPFGIVEMVRGASSSFKNQKYARKVVILHENKNAVQTARIRRIVNEAKNLSIVRHEHIIRFIATYSFDKQFAIIMDRADDNLQHYLQGRKSEQQMSDLLPWFECLINTIVYIHTIGIQHRDIKPTNILIKDKKVLLTDFGISKMGLGKTIPTVVPGWAREKNHGYHPPEVEDGSTRGRSADIFSLGAIFLEMFTVYFYPDYFEEIQTIVGSEANGSYARHIPEVKELIESMEQQAVRSDKWHSRILSLCKRMLDEDRTKRPLANEISSEWLLLPPSDRPESTCTCTATRVVDEANSSGDSAALVDTVSQDNANLSKKNVEDLRIVARVHQASKDGDVTLIENFIREGLDIDIQNMSGCTALHAAAENGRKEVVKELLKKGADADVQNKSKFTALHLAAQEGHKNVVQILIEEGGADANIQDNTGVTALHIAAKQGHEEVVRMLLGMNTYDNGQEDNIIGTASHFAIKSNHAEIGADVDTQDSKGVTALHIAARQGHERVVRMLLERGANREIEDNSRCTALQFANKEGRGEVVQILKGDDSVSSLSTETRSLQSKHVRFSAK